MQLYPLHQAFSLTAYPVYDSSRYLFARNRILRRTQVASKGLQEVNGCGRTAETVLAGRPPEQAEEATRSVALGCRLSYPMGNCLADILEPFQLDAPGNALGR